MKKISILIPVRNEIEGLPRLRETVSQLQQKLADQNYETEIVVTDNHSVDGSAAFLEEWANQPSDAIRYFRFARDYGFQTSLMYGMSQAEGDALVVLQSDLQDPPELILEFVSLWESGANVVAGVATNRDESFVSFSTRRVFYWTLDKSSDNTIMRGFQDFYLLDRSVYVPLSQGPRVHQFLRGRIAAEFGVDEVVEYQRAAREVGHSKFPFAAKYSLALDGLLLYGHRFFRTVSLVSALLLALSILVVIGLIVASLFGVRPPVAGWMSLAAGLAALMAVVAGGFSLVLEYLIRLYRLVAVSNTVILDKKHSDQAERVTTQDGSAPSQPHDGRGGPAASDLHR